MLHKGAIALDSRSNYVHAGKPVALVGVDALLVVSRARAQDVGKVVKMLEQLERGDLL